MGVDRELPLEIDVDGFHNNIFYIVDTASIAATYTITQTKSHYESLAARTIKQDF